MHTQVSQILPKNIYGLIQFHLFKDSKSLADIRNIKDRWILKHVKLLDYRPIIMEVLHQTISWRYFYLYYNKMKKR